MKKLGFCLTFCMFVLSITACILGVYASQPVAYNVTGKITYTVENFITSKTNITSLSATRICSHKDATGNVSTSTGVDIGNYFTVILNGETLTNSEIVTNITNNILTVSPQTGLTYDSGKIYMTPSQIIKTNGKTVENSYTLTLALKSDSTTTSQISISTTTTVGSWTSNLSASSSDNYSATCEEAGWEGLERCSVCETITDSGNVIRALGHDYDSGVVTTVATCTTKGVRTYTCQRSGCGKTKTEEIAIDSTNHDWKMTTAQVSAQNHVDGTGAIYTCSRCSQTKGGETLTRLHASYEVVDTTGYSATCTTDGKGPGTYCTQCTYDTRSTLPALGHDYDDGVITTSATCTTKGVKTFTCQRTGCGDTYTEDIDALGHDYQYDYSYTLVDDFYYKSNDSESHGYHSKTTTTTCSRCSYKTTNSEDEYCDLNEYTDSTWSSDDEAHWKHYYKVCSKCGGSASSSESDSGNLGVIYAVYSKHTGVATSDNYIAPTCTIDGVQYYKCSVCSTKYRGSISALGHDYKYSYTYKENDSRYYDTDADSHGYHDKITTTTCSRCDYSSTSKTTENCTTTETAESTYSTTSTAHYKRYIQSCSLCGGYAYSTNTYAVYENHNWNSGVTTTSETCTTTGEKTYTCTVCGYEKTETIAKLGHDYSYGSYSYTSGYTVDDEPAHYYSRTGTCSRCGDKTTDSGTTSCDLTSSSAGYGYNSSYHWTKTKWTCSYCGYSEITTGSNSSHSMSSYVSTSATCTTDGTRHYYCTTCDYSYNSTITKTGHSYTSKVTKSATCAASGVRTYTCSKCNDSYTETIAKTSTHSYGSWSSYSYSPQNCNYQDDNMTHTYSRTRTCTVCGTIDTDSGWEYCSYTTSSYQDYNNSMHWTTYSAKCNQCGQSDSYDGTSYSHSMTSKVTKSATCTTTGTRKYYCSLCSYYYTNTTAKTSHSYTVLVSSAVSATCTSSGKTAKYRCATCTATTGGTTVNATGHTKVANYIYQCGYCGARYSSKVSECTAEVGDTDVCYSTDINRVQSGYKCSKCGASIYSDPGLGDIGLLNSVGPYSSCIEYTDENSSSTLAVVDTTACVETGLGKKICVDEDE